jgi:hypothetical protein
MVTILAFLVVGRLILVRIEKHQRATGTYADRFVLVSDDGSARELTEREKMHLNGEYQPGDGNRPYIKSNYRALTPDGHMFGYLRRKKLPTGTELQL